MISPVLPFASGPLPRTPRAGASTYGQSTSHTQAAAVGRDDAPAVVTMVVPVEDNGVDGSGDEGAAADGARAVRCGQGRKDARGPGVDGGDEVPPAPACPPRRRSLTGSNASRRARSASMDLGPIAETREPRASAAANEAEPGAVSGYALAMATPVPVPAPPRPSAIPLRPLPTPTQDASLSLRRVPRRPRHPSAPPPLPRLDLHELAAALAGVRRCVHASLLDNLAAPESWSRGARVEGVVDMRRALEAARHQLREPQAMTNLVRRLDEILTQAMVLWPRGVQLSLRHQGVAERGLHRLVMTLADELARPSLDRTLPSSLYEIEVEADEGTAASMAPARALLSCPLTQLVAQVAEATGNPLCGPLDEAAVAMAGSTAQLLQRLECLVKEGSAPLLELSPACSRLRPEDVDAAVPFLRQLAPLAQKLRNEADTLQRWLRERVATVADLRAQSLRAVQRAAAAGGLPASLPCPIFARRQLPVRDRFDVDRILLLQLAVLDATEALVSEAERVGVQVRWHTQDLPGRVERIL